MDENGMTPVIIFVAMTVLSELELHFVSRNDERCVSIPSRDLSGILLDVVDTALAQNENVSGIVIHSGSLKSFALSRTVLATFNTIAWLHNVPILFLPESVQESEVNFEQLSRLIGKRKGFSGQLLPHYTGGPGITISQRSRKFTLE